MAGNRAEIRRIAGVGQQVGAELLLRGVVAVEQPADVGAKARPLVSARQSLPNRHGECGSPSRSLYLWCRRWSATQVSTGPSMASVPGDGQGQPQAGPALNEPCVK